MLSTRRPSWGPRTFRRARRRAREASSPAAIRSLSASSGPFPTSRRRRRCRSSVPSRQGCRPTPRESAPSRRRDRTTSPTTVPASASSSNATPTTAGGGHTTSTASSSTCGRRRPNEMLDEVERGDADWGRTLRDILFDPARGLAKKYGVNKSRFFVKPGLSFRGYALNTSRPLFRDNPRLRRAVNFAIDRSALEGGGGRGEITDQYLPAAMPGFKDAHIYPLRRPDLRRARALARGNTRGGKAVLYTLDFPQTLVYARIVRRNLAKIGLDVQVKGLPQVSVLLEGVCARRARRHRVHPVDARLHRSVLVPQRVLREPVHRKLEQRAARLPRLRPPAPRGGRPRGCGSSSRLRIARCTARPRRRSDGGDRVSCNEPTLVSKRVGCIVLRPELDLTAVCLK